MIKNDEPPFESQVSQLFHVQSRHSTEERDRCTDAQMHRMQTDQDWSTGILEYWSFGLFGHMNDYHTNTSIYTMLRYLTRPPYQRLRIPSYCILYILHPTSQHLHSANTPSPSPSSPCLSMILLLSVCLVFYLTSTT